MYTCFIQLLPHNNYLQQTAGLYNAETMYFEQLRTENNKGKSVPIPATKANMGRKGTGPLLNINTRWRQA
jgi:hypothetical protein